MNLVIFLHLVAITMAINYNPDKERAQRLEKRWNEVQAIPANEKTTERLTPICGRRPVPSHVSTQLPGSFCTPVGRTPDGEAAECDAFCCHQGQLTGFCGRNGCACTNDRADAFCGRDGSALGIRCPDVSACRRKCCREDPLNYNGGGRCGGILKLKCKC